MVSLNSTHFGLIGALTVFSIISKIVFDKVYLTSNLVVDEEFHLPLGEAYCKYEFNKWDPKVTTLPGLYLISSVLLGPLQLCSTYWLRLTSLIFSFVNVILFYCLLCLHNHDAPWKNVLAAINLSLLPPLYFFSHLYYTDVVSMTAVLLLFLSSNTGHHYFASISGICAILIRQTNIIWVGMVFACYIIKSLNTLINKKTSEININDLVVIVQTICFDLGATLKRTTLRFWLDAACYASSLGFFVIFVITNGSIVVGDKSAHEATLHLPQIFYFALFCLFFAWPHFLGEISSYLQFVKGHKIHVTALLILSYVVIYFNTLVHPYMLADNRHYVFYIWNRFYGRFAIFRYLIVPVYWFSLFVMLKKMFNAVDVAFLLIYVPCASIVLVTQRLLEFRYFFVPYVLFRTQLRNSTSVQLLAELLTYSLINFCTLHLFFTKSIEWSDYDVPQRLIW